MLAPVLCLIISLFEQLLCCWHFAVTWSLEPGDHHSNISYCPMCLFFGEQLTPFAATFSPLHLFCVMLRVPSGTWVLHRPLPFEAQSFQVHGDQQQQRLLQLVSMHLASFGAHFWHGHLHYQERFGLMPCLGFCSPQISPLEYQPFHGWYWENQGI